MIGFWLAVPGLLFLAIRLDVAFRRIAALEDVVLAQRETIAWQQAHTRLLAADTAKLHERVERGPRLYGMDPDS